MGGLQCCVVLMQCVFDDSTFGLSFALSVCYRPHPVNPLPAVGLVLGEDWHSFVVGKVSPASFSAQHLVLPLVIIIWDSHFADSSKFASTSLVNSHSAAVVSRLPPVDLACSTVWLQVSDWITVDSDDVRVRKNSQDVRPLLLVAGSIL